MNLTEIWKNYDPLNEGQALPDIDHPAALRPRQGMSILRTMKRMVGYNIGWALLIGSGYAALEIFVQAWQVRSVLGVALFCTVVGVWHTLRFYRTIDPRVQAGDLLAELRRNRAALAGWMHIQARAAILFYPFCLSAGFMLGGMVGSGRSVSEFMGRPHMALLLGATIVVMTPVSYWLGKWMFKASFGKVLGQVDEYIGGLES